MQLDEHFQRRLNEARMFFAEGKALAAEKIYRDLLKPDLPAGGRVLVLDGLGRCLHIQGRLEEAETFFRESLRFLSGENVKRPQRSANGRSTFLSKTCPPTICASPTHC